MAIRQSLIYLSLDVRNVQGTGATNGSVMTGISNFAYQTLKMEVQLNRLFLQTTELLPRNLDFFGSENLNWLFVGFSTLCFLP